MTLPRIPGVERVIIPFSKDLGDGFVVRRALPSEHRMMIGPFIFVDHFGPVQLAPGEGVDSRPHPHIGLATVSYLMQGEVAHRDSLGHADTVRSGDVAVMTAGRGIVHSERSTDAFRAGNEILHGLQCWLALPGAQEAAEPAFILHRANEMPTITGDGIHLRLLLGALGTMTAPGPVWTETLYADLALAGGRSFAMPAGPAERAAYVVSGSFRIDGGETVFGQGQLVVFEPGASIVIEAVGEARLMLLGGAPFGEKRLLWWNFVASTPERIEQAKEDWREQRFAPVPGETEFTPLPGNS